MMALAFLLAIGSHARGQAAAARAPKNRETLEQLDGRRILGRLAGGPDAGFRFEPESGGAGIALRPGTVVSAEITEPGAASAPPPFRLELGLDQRLSGRLTQLTERAVQFEDGPGGRALAVVRAGALGLLQRPGELQVLSEGFEAPGLDRWVQTGEPATVATPKLAGARSLRMPAGGASLTYRLPEPVVSGRMDVAFYDGGQRAADQRWFVDLTFRGSSGAESVRAVLGWDESTLGVESPQGPALAVQRLARRKGWHRLSARFGAGRIELSIDGDELAHGDGPSGPLAEIRLASHTTGRGEAPADLAGYFDELVLARLIEPAGGLEVDPTQDELRLTGGDQIFGRVHTADAERILVQVDTREIMLPWSEVSGMYFRRAPTPAEPVEGLLVRAEWLATSGREATELDRIEGVLAGLSDTTVTIQAPYAGGLQVPRNRLRRIQVLGPTRRVVLDPFPHHLGNEIFDREIKLDPPQPEGSRLDLSFDVERPVAGAAELVLDVVQVAGEAESLMFAPQIKRGELRTNVLLNGKPLDYLNRHIRSKNETPERIRLPIAAGALRTGKNVIRFQQVPEARDPQSLDDLGILCIALEFEPGRPSSPRPETPGP